MYNVEVNTTLIKESKMLKFSRGNAKLDKLESVIGGQVWTFSMLAGVACPQAKECKSQVVFNTEGKARIQDGKHTKFRCFSASQEVLFPALYKARKHNLDSILLCQNNKDRIVELISLSLPKKAKAIRIHVSGDFITQNYFDAWCEVAKMYPDMIFYAYTKSLPFWVKRLGTLPNNFILTASYGGNRDDLIGEYNLRSALVVENEEEANKLGLKVDHDDSIAISNGPSFALTIHGPQPKGSKSAKNAKLNGYKRKPQTV